eukprot:1362134-Amorphochlora_amoeboformis.AAC.1
MESDTGLVIVGGRLYPKDHHHKQKKDKSDIDDEDLDAEDDINSLEETAEVFTTQSHPNPGSDRSPMVPGYHLQDEREAQVYWA